jgi:hypothetical protein
MRNLWAYSSALSPRIKCAALALSSVNSTVNLLFVFIPETMTKQDTDIIWPLHKQALHTIMAAHGFYVVSLLKVL